MTYLHHVHGISVKGVEFSSLLDSLKPVFSIAVFPKLQHHLIRHLPSNFSNRPGSDTHYHP